MRTLPAGPRGRPGPWPGAAVVVLLAVLVHLLGCAHGPVPDGAGRTDTVVAAASAPIAASTATAPVRGASGPVSRPAEGGDTHCWGMDQPTAQPPRDRTQADATQIAPSALGHLPAAVPVRERADDERPHTAWCSQRERARLGVWRT
ncbi:hypothetical protein [Streptomyces sp. VRA16 Mangrove soil]|uniref:hypothetical protein n=1 Tax=Streptomyces sp. VRA16 Mangrove soil TaxID=2817434 RepID=UPI001A9E19BB|nr:hypothetical protein [Streptomyces sp. VRA16 Mangrove soil]MBO1335683.1 hypothetical protein [Streptomyces sp. VRA16 Mangrove soil]